MGNMENLYQYRFVIVELHDKSQREDGLLPIDLVPRTWVKEIKGKYTKSYSVTHIHGAGNNGI